MQYDRTLYQVGRAEDLVQFNDEKKRITFVAEILKPIMKKLHKSLKCNPFIIIKGETTSTLSSFSNKNKNLPDILLHYQENPWMNTNLYVDFIWNSIPDDMKEKRVLLVHDNFEAHLDPIVIEKAIENNIII